MTTLTLSTRSSATTKTITELIERSSLILATLAIAIGSFTQFAAALPGDYVWQESKNGIVGDRLAWRSVASSADGTKLAAAVADGYIYTSADSGVTWTEQTAAGSRNWSSIASSSDGVKLAAVAYGGYIYTSTDSGVTWTEQTAAGSRSWSSIASSSDGVKLAAVAYGGYIYTSTDSGVTWTEQTAAGSRYWSSVTNSSDGSQLAAAVEGGFIYLGTLEGPATATTNMSDLPSTSQGATDPAISTAVLSATSMTCYTFDQPTIKTLAGSSVIASDPSIDIIGGVSFNLNCTENGGSADMSLALGSYYQDTSKLRVYKGDSTNGLTDVTSQVTIANQTTSSTNQTVISYTATDGANFDEDNTANSVIVDPLYIGIEHGTTPSDPNNGSLADTGINTWLVVVASGIVMLSGMAVVLAFRQRVGRV